MRDVVKVQSEPPRPQRPRRRRRNLTLHYALFIAAAVVLFLILSRTVLFRINEYDISGNNIYTNDQILNAGNLRYGRNMYGINLKKTAERIKSGLIYIDDISLRRKLPDKFIIEVTEAKAYACCEYEGSRYAVITKGGRYLETEQLGARAGLIQIKGMELVNVALGEDFESADETKRDIILDILEAIDEICPDKITEIDITDRTNIVMIYDGRIEVDFGSSLDYEYKLKYISALIENNLEPEAEGTVIYHSSAAGASFIRKEDMELTEQEREAEHNAAQNAPETDSGDGEGAEDGQGD